MQKESQHCSTVYNNYSDYRHKMSSRSSQFRQKRNLQLAEAQRLLDSTYISNTAREVDLLKRKVVDAKGSNQNENEAYTFPMSSNKDCLCEMGTLLDTTENSSTCSNERIGNTKRDVRFVRSSANRHKCHINAGDNDSVVDVVKNM